MKNWQLMIRRWRIAAPYRLRLCHCVHRGFTMHSSRRHHHPDGRPENYERCCRCLRVTWRPWETWPFNSPRWRKMLVRAQGRWRTRKGTGS